MYVKENKSTLEISGIKKCTERTVINIFKKYRIPIRLS